MISLTSAKDFSNLAISKASHVFSTKCNESSISTAQEHIDSIDAITPEQLAIFSTQAHAWMTIISDKPLNKQSLERYGVDINKIINITHSQISANKINQISKHNQSFVVMLQKNESTALAQPFYSQLLQQCEEQNLRLVSLTQDHIKTDAKPVQLSLLSFDMQTA